jgi:hypothetical protein
MKIMNEKLLTLKGVAQLLGISYEMAKGIVKNHNDLPRVRLNNRNYFKENSVLMWWNSQEKTVN